MNPAPAASASLSALVTPVTRAHPLTVNEFIPDTKPGNVAVCLSGGGSRAMTAGMGQLNAFQGIEYSAGVSLFSQVLALSTVSGGSWLGVPLTYLPSKVSDLDYLGGAWNPPGELTLSQLGMLPSNCVGKLITSDFTAADLVLHAVLLLLEGVRPDMLWQTLIGLHFLKPYGLFDYKGLADVPNSYFTYDEAARKAIVASNAPLAKETANVVSTLPRPYLACNASMFVTVNLEPQLAPVQATSFMTGIFSTPPGATDANARAAGGGGVTSFAFSSVPSAFDSGSSVVTVAQSRQLALMDIVGTSSAFFASVLRDTASMYASHPDQFAQLVKERGAAAFNFFRRIGVDATGGSAALTTAVTEHASGNPSKMVAALSALDDVIPAYQYWPAADPPITGVVNTTEFADGGLLDNTGIASILSYGDVEKVVAFINTATTITQTDGVVVVDDSIPPLFGYQPYNNGPYCEYGTGTMTQEGALMQNNQVFSYESFQPMRDALWAASGSGTYDQPPVYVQSLVTLANPWFGVDAGRSITVVWVYLERVQAWYNQLPADVQALLGPFDSMVGNFPHYSTVFATQLSTQDINLLVNLTGWVIRNDASLYKSLFQS